MLHHYKAQSLTSLAEKLSSLLHKESVSDPFQAPWIVVQNKETQQWLSLKIAEQRGIAGNLEFVLPSELMWKLYRKFKPDTPKLLPADRLPLQWQIFGFLNETDPEIFKKVKGFPEIADKTQAFRLSGLLADVFDLYQVYRPEMTEGWKEGKFFTQDSHESWQLWVWRALQLRFKSSHALTDRASAYNELLNLISKTGETTEIPTEIHCFGLSQYSEPFTQLITLLSNKTNVFFYSSKIERTSPDKVNQSWDQLITEWGAPKFNSENLLEDLLSKNSIEEELLKENDSGSLLLKLTKGVKASGLVQIHSCHNAKREVEVLKDSLLSRFDQNDDLSPEDVLVLVPDFDEYAPLIDAVFSFNDEEPSIPVYVPSAFNKPDIKSFKVLLELLSGKIKANDLIGFLELESIQKNFEFNEDDLSVIRNWLLKNNGYWGLDSDDSSFSFKKVSNSLISGYITEPDQYETIGEFIPYNSISTTDQFNLSSRFSFVIQKLIEFRKSLNQEKTLDQWIELFKKRAASLVGEMNKTLFAKLDELSDACKSGGYNEPVSFDVIKKWIVSQLDDVQASSSGLGHGVVLSSYVPYRGIPFREVYIMGMNETVFPRNPGRPNFDLINNHPKPGDRITKDDDALLFLEILNSVSDQLYVSYKGQDMYTNTEKLPSVLLQKLIDVIKETDDNLKIRIHKLHGFDSNYFLQKESYSRYRKELFDEISAGRQNPNFKLNLETVQPVQQENIIQLNDLIAYFKNPCKEFLRKELMISDVFEENELADREHFTLDGLGRWVLNNEIITALESGLEVDKIETYVQNAGILPEGVAGSKTFNSHLNEVGPFKKRIDELKISEPEVKQIELEINGVQIMGSVNGLFENSRINWRTGKRKAKYLIDEWINHLVVSVADPDFKQTKYLTKEEKYHKLTIINRPDNPLEILSILVEWYLDPVSKTEDLAFFPDSSFAYASSFMKDGSHESALLSARNKWESTEYRNNEDADFYNGLIWRGVDPLDCIKFEEFSRSFWDPFLKNESS